MKKTIFCLLFTILLFFSAGAQEKSKWSIGLSAMPEYCYRLLDISKYSKDELNYAKKYDEFRIGYSIGGQVNRFMTKRISLQSGLFFSDYGYQTKKHYDTNYAVSNYPVYHFWIDGIDEKYSICHIYDINIPLLFKYKILNRQHFYWDFGIGFSLNILFQKKDVNYTKSINDDKWTRSTSVFNTFPFYFFSNSNTTLGYKFKNCTLNFEISYSISALNFNKDYSNYLYGFGTGVNIMFDIHKKNKN